MARAVKDDAADFSPGHEIDCIIKYLDDGRFFQTNVISNYFIDVAAWRKNFLSRYRPTTAYLFVANSFARTILFYFGQSH
jgi:hypothetical protein